MTTTNQYALSHLNTVGDTTVYFPFLHGDSLTPSSNGFTTESNANIPLRFICVVQNLFIIIDSNSMVQSSTFRTRKNNANGNQSVSIASTTTGIFVDTGDIDSISSGDLLDYQWSTADVASNSATFSRFGCQISAQQATVKFGGYFTTVPSFTYFPLVSAVNQTNVESRTQLTIQNSGTFKNLFANVATNTYTHDVTIQTRKNTANGTASILIISSTTGIFEDLVDTDTVVATNTYNLSQSHTSGSGAFTAIIGIEHQATTGAFSYWQNGAPASIAINFNVTTNLPCVGQSGTNSTESLVQVKTYLNQILSQMYISISANTIATTATTLKLRQNGADSALAISIGAGASGAFSDTTHTVSLESSDLINYQIITPNTSGSITFDFISMYSTDVFILNLYPFYTNSFIRKLKLKRLLKRTHKKMQYGNPKYDYSFKNLPALSASIYTAPIQPDPNKQLITQRKHKKISRIRRTNIKTFQQTILTVLLIPFQVTAGQPYYYKQIIPILKRKVQKRRKLNLKFGTPQYKAWQKTNPALDPSIWAAAIQPDRMKQYLGKWIKKKYATRRRMNFKRFPQLQSFFDALLQVFVAETQPYMMKQIIPKIKRKIQKRRSLNRKRFPTYQDWIATNPSLAASIWTAAIQPDRFKQLIPKFRHRIQIKRFSKSQRTTPKYQAWFTTNSPLSASIWAAAIQPYLLKQLIPKFKRKILLKRKLKFKLGSPRFDAWFKDLPFLVPYISPMLPDRMKQLIPHMKRKILARRKRIIASEVPTTKYQSWVLSFVETLQSISLTIINILNKALKVSR